jgi:hypothetical protein
LPMDRAKLLHHLVEAERHVADGERHLDRQRRIVAYLKRARCDVRKAVGLLAQFEEMQARHISDRDSLRKELGR